MRIRHISVRGLFGVFDHEIPLNMDDRITIIYGPNGFGKTYSLSLVNELFNPGFGHFFSIPFDQVSVTLDDGGVVSVGKPDDWDDERLVITYDAADGQHRTFGFRDLEEKMHAEPGWLSDLKEAVQVEFIHTERLIEITGDDWRAMTETITGAAQEDDIRSRLFMDIVNERFTHKKLTVTPDRRLEFVTSFGGKLGPQDLSSGERHVLLLLYRLLFVVRPDSLILVDEPELSLHIVWQQEFLRDIEKVLGCISLDILIATHSPQIIHDRWDLAVELKGPAR